MKSQRRTLRRLAVAAVLALAGVSSAPPSPTDLVLRLQPVEGLRVDESVEPARALAWTEEQLLPAPSVATPRGETFDLELPGGCAAGTILVVEAWGGVSAPLAVAPGT